MQGGGNGPNFWRGIGGTRVLPELLWLEFKNGNHLLPFFVDVFLDHPPNLQNKTVASSLLFCHVWCFHVDINCRNRYPNHRHVNFNLSYSQLTVFSAAQDLPLQYILFYSLPSVLLWAICRDVDLWWPQVAPMLRKYFFRLVLIAFTVGLGIGCLVSFQPCIFLLF